MNDSLKYIKILLINQQKYNSFLCLCFGKSNECEIQLLRVSVHELFSYNTSVLEESSWSCFSMIDRCFLSPIKLIESPFFMDECNEMSINFVLLIALSFLYSRLMTDFQWCALHEVVPSFFWG